MTTPSPQAKDSARFTVASLLSPPELKKVDSFTSSANTMLRTPSSSFSSERLPGFCAPANDSSSRVYASPPISPFTKLQKEGNTEEEVISTDPLLFSHSDNRRSVASDVPLFSQEEQLDPAIETAIDHHTATNDASFAAKGISKPTREDYRLAASVSRKPAWSLSYGRDAWGYYRREVGFLRDYPYSTGISKNKTGGKPALKKLAPAPSSSTKRTSTSATVVKPRAQRPPKRTPQQKVLDSFEFSPPSATKAARAPSSREDRDFDSLPDFSPPVDTLPNNKCLKVEWKGQPLNLDEDPHLSLLHEAEQSIAGILRLDCATYLCSKRRIFQARVEALRKGKEFRKTDAQQACKIDVNKASKLWSAYEKVGWLNPRFFVQYI